MVENKEEKVPEFIEKELWPKGNKLDSDKILHATDIVAEASEELGYEHDGMLCQLLDELDSLVMEKLDEQE